MFIGDFKYEADYSIIASYKAIKHLRGKPRGIDGGDVKFCL